MKINRTVKLISSVALIATALVFTSCSDKNIVSKNNTAAAAPIQKKDIDFGDIPRNWVGLTFSHTDYIRFKQCGMEIPSLTLEEKNGEGIVRVNTGKDVLVYNVESIAKSGSRYQIETQSPELGIHTFEFRYTEEDRNIGVWTSINYNHIKTEIDYIVAADAENIKLLEDQCEEEEEDYKVTITTLFQENEIEE